jgi:hypothetical protein
MKHVPHHTPAPGTATFAGTGLSRHDELVCGNCLEKFSTVKM